MLGRLVQVYYYDILIFSKAGEEHFTHLQMVLFGTTRSMPIR